MAEGTSLLFDFEKSTFDRYARLALDGVVRTYPNQPGYYLASESDLVEPQDKHPAFYGCYDWHSAVHSHWLLARLLRARVLSPAIAREAECVLREHLSAGRLAAEQAYFERPRCGHFEWPYGWAWLLVLHAEVVKWDGAVADALAPFADYLSGRVPDMLARMRAPQRSGQHGDTAFALQLMLEAGVDDTLTDTICAAALRWFGGDHDYPWRYEQGPYDFHSAGLSVIGLMQQVMDADAFRAWLALFWPGVSESPPDLKALADQVTCPDDADGRLAHLHGLNLERARGLAQLASVWHADSERWVALREAARRHAAAGLAGVLTGEYAGEHWLATFAVRLLLTSGVTA